MMSNWKKKNKNQKYPKKNKTNSLNILINLNIISESRIMHIIWDFFHKIGIKFFSNYNCERIYFISFLFLISSSYIFLSFTINNSIISYPITLRESISLFFIFK